tara:strand:- start:156 stop:383 length:228 start_codon:yes stop_codon:yes gene_type:complete
MPKKNKKPINKEIAKAAISDKTEQKLNNFMDEVDDIMREFDNEFKSLDDRVSDIEKTVNRLCVRVGIPKLYRKPM